VRQRIYIDTSVFGGYYDEEFAKHTIPLFNRIRDGEFIVLLSSITQEELENAPKEVQQIVKNLKAKQTEFVETTEEIVDLATSYISEKVVGQASFADCLHIAIATVYKADFLISTRPWKNRGTSKKIT